MEILQNPTTAEPDNGDVSQRDVELQERQEYYITYYAANGLSVHDDGSFEKISAEKFAAKIGVHRTTLYEWQKSIPNFQARVRARRKEIFNGTREAMIWNGLFLRAAKGDSKQAEMLLSHFSDYVPPTQRHEVKIGGLADLAKIARKKQAGVIDVQ